MAGGRAARGGGGGTADAALAVLAAAAARIASLSKCAVGAHATSFSRQRQLKRIERKDRVGGGCVGAHLSWRGVLGPFAGVKR
jgi:hypothetical protein